jgi:threonine synthase
MKFISTRGGVIPTEIRQALVAGLAPDGGLFVPEVFPYFKLQDFDGATTLAEVAEILIRPFFAGDSDLALALPAICKSAFNFPIPLTPVPNRPGDFLLELFHGPTSAFKDVGARFLASCLERIGENKEHRSVGPDSATKKRTVIVATSGDTGGAVAAAFFGKKGIDVVILYPKGRISPRQEKQLCAWGGNIQALAVEGTFDDCQRIAKEALVDQFAPRTWLSANSINLGRILPQMAYYAYCAIVLARKEPDASPPGFIIPSGNLGNSLACLWAKTLGLPIGPIHLALNANRGVVDFLSSGKEVGHETIATLANAMDVSKPSNLERFKSLFPVHANLAAQITADSVSDTEIRNEIKTSEVVWGQVLCPHTAVAAVSRKRMSSEASKRRWVIVATAHPAKFETIVEPLIGHEVAIPPLLAEILKLPSEEHLVKSTYEAVLNAISM